MNKLPALVAASICAASLSAQGTLDLPSSENPAFELNSYELVPFQQPNARIQMFYGASEVGTTPIVATEMSWRFDGPIPQVGAPGPFSIQQFIVRVGKTAIPQPRAKFDANLTEALTEVFNAPWSYFPDPGSATPAPWGGVGDTLKWVFSQPVPISLNAGEWLVVDVQMIGNNISNFGFAHAIVDGAATPGGVTDGASTNFGTGCSVGIGLAPATASVEGTVAPGAAHFLNGQELGANALALGLFGLDDLAYQGVPLPFTLPGTSCTLLTSAELSIAAIADANGNVTGTAMALDVPAVPALSGMSLYEQLAALAPGTNSFGIVFSDAVEVTLGNFATPAADYYMVAHDYDAGAAYANIVRPFGYAMRLGTL